jgi:hypothetical protein
MGTRRAVAAAIAELPKAQKEGPDFVASFDMLQKFSTSGVADHAATADDLAVARAYARKSWPGLLAAMLLVPAWQFPEAPRLDDVPTWLWPVYSAYLFYTPRGFCAPGQADAYAAHYLRRLMELSRLAERNRGSTAVRLLLKLYSQNGSCAPLLCSVDSLRRHFELRGRILALASGIGRQEEPLILPRLGRRMRVGFVCRDFGSRKQTYATIPYCEHLDPERFEVILFAYQESGSVVEAHARNHSAKFQVLPSGLEAQVGAMRAAALDVLVFGMDVAAAADDVARLAIHRLAPLQIAGDTSHATSGLPEIDLFVTGTLTESAESSEGFTERLGLLPGMGRCFEHEVDRQNPTTHWTRAVLGLSNDSVVFVSAADFQGITPELQETWAGLLAAVSGSRLLLHSFGSIGESDFPIKRFCAGFDRVLSAHEVTHDRLLVSTMQLESRADVCSLLAIGDIYLDTSPFSDATALVDSLEVGVPPVVWEGNASRSRAGAGLLRSIGLEELVAHDAGSYHALAVGLALAPDRRVSLRKRIGDKLVRMPLFLDTLAASDSFGALLEKAYDELFQFGREAFRSKRAPLVTDPVPDPSAAIASAGGLFSSGWFSEAADEARRVLTAHPAHAGARHLLAAALLRQGRGDRALTYLEAAIKHSGSSASLWHDLAIALHHNGRGPDSLEALQTCLRLDGNRTDSRMLLLEWEAELRDAARAAKAAESGQAAVNWDSQMRALAESTVETSRAN